MKRLTRFCDRCESVIVDRPGSILEAKHGDVAQRLDDRWVDLCPDCSAGFIDWLKAGHPELPRLYPIETAAS